MHQPPLIRLLTGGDVVIGSPHATAFKGRNSRALFVLLALEADVPVPRDSLATWLWPESSQVAARSNLRMALMQLRRTLDAVDPELLEADAETLRLRLDPDQVDCLRFGRLATRQRLNAHIEALELYRGGLLDGPPALPGQAGERIRVERERLRAIALDTGLATLAVLRDQDDDQQIAIVARATLMADPACEPAHRALMRVCARAGDRTAALHQFELCRIALADLGDDLRPAADTLALRDAIANAPEPLGTANASSGNAASAARPIVLAPPIAVKSVPIRNRIGAASALIILVTAVSIWFVWPAPECGRTESGATRIAVGRIDAYGQDAALAAAVSTLSTALRRALARAPWIVVASIGTADASVRDANQLRGELTARGDSVELTLWLGSCGLLFDDWGRIVWIGTYRLEPYMLEPNYLASTADRTAHHAVAEMLDSLN